MRNLNIRLSVWSSSLLNRTGIPTSSQTLNIEQEEKEYQSNQCYSKTKTLLPLHLVLPTNQLNESTRENFFEQAFEHFSFFFKAGKFSCIAAINALANSWDRWGNQKAQSFSVINSPIQPGYLFSTGKPAI